MRTPGSMVKRRSAQAFRSRVESLEGRELLTLDVTPYPLDMILRSTPTSLVKGPNQNLWVTESEAGKIAEVAPSGAVVKEYTLPGFAGRTLASVVATNDALWFSEYVTDASTGAGVGKIVRFTPADQKITEFPVETGATVAALAVGADGNIWFTENVYNNGTDAPRVGKLTPDGKLATFAVPGASGYFGEIVAGPGDSLWFLDSASSDAGSTVNIGKITTDGVATVFPVQAAGIYAGGLAAGPDGNVWFSIVNYAGQSGQVSIASMTPTGTVKTYPLSSDVANYTAIRSMSPGGDGNVWFTTDTKVGKITPTGAVSTKDLPNAATPLDLALGSDGNVWYSASVGSGSLVAKVTPASDITIHALPTSTTTDPALGFSVSPSNLVWDDAAHWFTTNDGSKSRINKVDNTGKLTSFDLTPTQTGGLDWVNALVKGPDGNFWFSSSNNVGGSIGKITADGTVTRVAIPSGFSPTNLLAAADGNLWSYGPNAKGQQQLLRVTPTGATKLCPLPKGVNLEGPVLAAPDGRIWLGATRTKLGHRAVSLSEVIAFNPTSRRFSEYVMPKNPNGPKRGVPIPLAAAASLKSSRTASAAASSSTATTSVASQPAQNPIIQSPTSPIPAGDGTSKLLPPVYSRPYFQPVSMVAGRDGAVWISATAGSSSRIVRVTARGKMTSYDVPGTGQVGAITVGSDGNYWFALNKPLYYPVDIRAGYFNSGPATIGRITPTGVVSTFTLPDGFTQISGLTSGSDNLIWLTDANSSKLGKFAPPPLFSGALDPKEVKGSAPSTTNDPTPTFNGTAHPNTRVTLYGVGPNNVNIPIGSVLSDATGAWKLKADHAIPDGTYNVMGGETNDAGVFVGNAIQINDGKPLTVDTAGPRILPTYAFDPTTRTLGLTVSDAGSGFDVSSAAGGWVPYLSDPSTYSIIPEGSTKSLGFNVKLGEGPTTGTVTVLLTLTDPVTPPGRLKLVVKASNLLDQAGNQLDGENRAASLPSGNGKPGGDFVAWISQDGK